MDGGSKKQMDQEAKARIMSSEAKKPGAGGNIESGTFASRTQSAADKNSNK